MKNYCFICGAENTPFLVTNRGEAICITCADKEKLCEICGALPTYKDQPEDERLHFDEDCFK